MNSFSGDGVAVVFGGTGGIGRAVVQALAGHFKTIVALGRRTDPGFDLNDEATIAKAIAAIAHLGQIHLVIDATGFLHDDAHSPEKSLRELNAAHMAKAFAINTIGPALIMKHALPQLPREGKAVFATLSAKVGSIGDNDLGGWYSYRASKAALNQLTHTAAIELARRCPQAICVCLHPGTVETNLSSPFHRVGLKVQSPAESAAALLDVIDKLTPAETGGFFSYDGSRLPW